MVETINEQILYTLKEILKTLIENQKYIQEINQEQREHWQHMHKEDPEHEEAKKMAKEYMEMVKRQLQPMKEEQEEWDRKLGKDKK